MDASLPFVSLKPNYFTTYVRFDSTRSKLLNKDSKYLQPISNITHGIISAKANKRVKLAIDWMIYNSKSKVLFKKGQKTSFSFKLNFITLTLSSKQVHPDGIIKKMLLNHFLVELRSKYGCKNYLWRAESQRNGNIHFHVCSDVFVPWRTLRNDWNRIQNKLGYIDRYTVKTGKVNPNSTDVHSIKKIKNLSGYLAKYCSKNSKGYTVLATKCGAQHTLIPCLLTFKQPKLSKKPTFYRQIHGKLWGVSQNVSKFKSAACEIEGKIRNEINWLWHYKKDKITLFERATIYSLSIKELLACKCTALANVFLDYIKNIDVPKIIIEQVPIYIPVYTHKAKILQTSLILT